MNLKGVLIIRFRCESRVLVYVNLRKRVESKIRFVVLVYCHSRLIASLSLFLSVFQSKDTRIPMY